MFLEKRTVKHDTKRIQIVSFCNDCSSQEIETIQTCKKCGSHNIEHGSAYGDDPRGYKKIIVERQEPFYKCDYCGKEFNGFDTPKSISFVDGTFEIGSFPSETNFIFTVEKDICKDCLEKVRQKLEKDLLGMLNKDSFDDVVEETLVEKGDNNESYNKEQ